MERRRALVVAGTLSASLALAGTAMAVNLGLLGADADPVGDLQPTVQPVAAERPERPARQRPRVRVIVQDIPVAAGGSSSAAGGTSAGTPSGTTSTASAAPATASTAGPAPTYSDDHDDSGYDDDHEVEDEDDHEVEDEEDHEVEDEDD
jgi:hypothetical protein